MMKTLLLCPLLVAAVTFPAQAGSIGLHFIGDASEVSAATGQSSIAAENWNEFSAGTTVSWPLKDATGAATGAFVSFSHDFTNSTGNSDLGNLLNGCLDTSGGTVTIKLLNVPYVQYDVYAYVGGAADNLRGTATIGTTSLGFRSDSHASSYSMNANPAAGTPVANTLRFVGVGTAGGAFTFTLPAGPDGDIGLHGLEIVQVGTGLRPAQITNINGDITTPGNPSIYAGPGALGTGGSVFNGIPIKEKGPVALVDSSGQPTGVVYSNPTASNLNGGDFTNFNANPPQLQLLTNFLSRSGAATFTLSGLTNGKYNLAIYTSGFAGNVVPVTVNGVTKTTTSTGNYITFVQGQNYVFFNDLEVTDGTLSATYGSPSSGTVRFSGFQLQTIIPDPIKLLAFVPNQTTHQATFTWQSSTGKSYRITSSPTLDDWSNVIQSGISGAAGQTSVTVSIPAAPSGFFRVEEEAAP